MKNKGFTLVEVIIVIAILGVLIMIVFPSVSRLQQNNKYKKFTSFGESIVASGKLYVDQYQEDLWGSSTAVGTKTVDINTLINANLLKSYTDKKDKCNSGSLSITRSGTKNKFNYTYTYTVNCTLSKKEVVCTGDANTSQCTSEGKIVYNDNG